ncbi:hypothetical protein F4678DRAFT_440557 [Xylaria arbuscula]|nr:hypothetical protein F4678DRAFT_440557 [Xylaria arbuscula]
MIGAKLKVEYSCQISEGTLKIFFVDNNLYWLTKNAPLFSPEISDISQLREYGTAMASKNRFILATNHIRTDIGRLLKELSVWAQPT